MKFSTKNYIYLYIFIYYIYLYVYVYVYIYIYKCIYIYRERKNKESERVLCPINTNGDFVLRLLKVPWRLHDFSSN